MNGELVDYRPLIALHDSLDVSQRGLQKFCILSRELLEYFRDFRLHKLHAMIQYKQDKWTARAMGPKLPVVEPKEPEQVPDLAEIPEVPPEVDTIKSVSIVVPLTNSTKWSSMEINAIPSDKTLSHKQAYNLFVKTCQREHCPLGRLEGFAPNIANCPNIMNSLFVCSGVHSLI